MKCYGELLAEKLGEAWPAPVGVNRTLYFEALIELREQQLCADIQNALNCSDLPGYEED